MNLKTAAAALLAAACAAAGAPTTRQAAATSPDAAAARVTALADSFVAAYLDRFPEVVTFNGIPGGRHDRLTDNSLAALRRDLDARDAAHRRELEARDAEAARLRAEMAELRAQVQALARAQAATRSP